MKYYMILLLPLLSLNSACVATTVGVVVGTAVSVTTTAVTLPVKAGSAIVGAISDEEEKEENEDQETE